MTRMDGPAGRKPKLYLLHVRKTAGTAICQAIVASAGPPLAESWEQVRSAAGTVTQIGNLRVAGWSADLRLDFNFGFSHTPYPQVIGGRESGAFLFTCIRDPVERLISYWKMLKDYIGRGDRAYIHPALEQEQAFFRPDIVEFAHSVPAFHRENLAHMFDPASDPEQGLVRARRLGLIMEQTAVQEGLALLNRLTGWSIPPARLANKSSSTSSITEPQIKEVRKLLTKDFQFYEGVRRLPNFHANIRP